MHSLLRELTQRFFCLRWQDGLPPLQEQLCNRWGRGGEKNSCEVLLELFSSHLLGFQTGALIGCIAAPAKKKPPKNRRKKKRKNLLESAKECRIYCVKVAVKSHRRKTSALNEIFALQIHWMVESLLSFLSSRLQKVNQDFWKLYYFNTFPQVLKC